MQKHTWKSMVNYVPFHEIQEGELKIIDVHEINKVAKEDRK